MSRTLRIELIAVGAESDLVQVRQLTRQFALELGFGVLDLTKLVTAASELGRNTLLHGLGGTLKLEIIAENERQGVRLTFEDKGPGIADVEQALKSGFTTKRGLGLGFGGSKRLVDEFNVTSRVGEGTSVTVVRWK
jgi:serine/threonine-protein kinase RsbT